VTSPTLGENPESEHDSAPESEVPRLGFVSGSQRELLEALGKQHRRLAQTYEGALRTFSDERNPDCLAQSAHSMRELFDALPLAVGPPPRKPADLKGKVREITNAWVDALQKTTTIDGQKWAGEIDSHLAKFLERLAQFFKWFDEEHPKHTMERDLVLDHFDPGHRQLPPQLRRQRGESVGQIQRYMNSVAHHNIDPSRAEFAAKLAEAEALIRIFVKPAPYADRKTIDAILKGSGQ
jgi:hypothetical protein